MLSVRLPKYRRHKGSGQAVVTLGGREVYLGRHGTAASRQAYDRLTAEYLAAGRHLPPPVGPSDLTVAEVIAAYWRHAADYYRKDGEATSELICIRAAMRPLKRLYGDTPAAAFGPLALKAVRQAMVDGGRDTGGGLACHGAAVASPEKPRGLSRSTINGYVARIKRMFKWAAAQELVPGGVHHALAAVDGLKKGRCEAREAPPVRPVAEVHVHRTMPFLPPAVAAMVELQVLTGMRSGEVTAIRGCDLSMAGAVWQYRPPAHKTAHHGHERVIDLGPRAQAVIRPWLKADLEAYLFSPCEGEAARNGARRASRRTPLTPSALARYRRAERRRRARPAGSRYMAESYRRAVERGVERANERIAADLAARGVTDPAEVAAEVPHWHPHQLRHTYATEVRRRYGLEVARVMLGHHSVGVTEVYAERDLAVAARVAAEVG